MVSIVTIVYNQINSLRKVISGFARQTTCLPFELIVVDDGSTDGLELLTRQDLAGNTSLTIQIIHLKNGGRSRARNQGVACANGEWVIFCDGDRIPGSNFVEEHAKAQILGNDVVVGTPYDYFGRLDWLDDGQWDRVQQFSRLPHFFKQSALLIENIPGSSPYVWLGFLAGNASVRKSRLIEAGGFDERFVEWGFEHFDLGLRLQKAGCQFFLQKGATNYHIPHKRPNNFYKNMIEKNICQFAELHPDVDSKIMRRLLLEGKTIEETIR